MRSAEELRAAVKGIRQTAGLSVRAMAERLNMSSSGYSHYEQRIKSKFLPMPIAQQIADVVEPLGVPRADVLELAWLSDEPEMEIRDVPPRYSDKDAVGPLLAPRPSPSRDAPEEALKRIEPGEEGPSDKKLIPVFDLAASAGFGAVVDHETVVYSLAFPPAYLKRLTSSAPANLAIISVKGESMEPTLLDDDIVLLDASKTNLSYDGLFVLRFNDALHVKRIGRSYRKGHVTIISDNKDLYPQIEAPVDEIDAVGKVLWYGRKV